MYAHIIHCIHRIYIGIILIVIQCFGFIVSMHSIRLSCIGVSFKSGFCQFQSLLKSNRMEKFHFQKIVYTSYYIIFKYHIVSSVLTQIMKLDINTNLSLNNMGLYIIRITLYD